MSIDVALSEAPFFESAHAKRLRTRGNAATLRLIAFAAADDTAGVLQHVREHEDAAKSGFLANVRNIGIPEAALRLRVKTVGALFDLASSRIIPFSAENAAVLAAFFDRLEASDALAFNRYTAAARENTDERLFAATHGVDKAADERELRADELLRAAQDRSRGGEGKGVFESARDAAGRKAVQDIRIKLGIAARNAPLPPLRQAPQRQQQRSDAAEPAAAAVSQALFTSARTKRLKQGNPALIKLLELVAGDDQDGLRLHVREHALAAKTDFAANMLNIGVPEAALRLRKDAIGVLTNRLWTGTMDTPGTRRLSYETREALINFLQRLATHPPLTIARYVKTARDNTTEQLFAHAPGDPNMTRADYLLQSVGDSAEKKGVFERGDATKFKQDIQDIIALLRLTSAEAQPEPQPAAEAAAAPPPERSGKVGTYAGVPDRSQGTAYSGMPPQYGKLTLARAVAMRMEAERDRVLLGRGGGGGGR